MSVKLPVGERVLRAACALLIAAVLVYATTRIPGLRGDIGGNVLLDGVLGSGVYLLALAIVALRVVLRRHDRAAWAVVVAGGGCFAAGNAYSSAVLAHLAVPPVPSVADALWLAFYPCAYAFVVLKLRGDLKRLRVGASLEGLIGYLGAAALGAAVVFGLIGADTTGSVLRVMTNLAYPVCAVVLLTIVVGSFGLFDWRPTPTWLLIGMGMAVNAVANALYLYQTSRGTFQEGHWLESLWAVALALLATAAVWPDEKSKVRSVERLTVSVVPLLFSVTSVSVLVVSSLVHVARAAVVLSAATLLAAGIQTCLMFREVSQLADTRRLARTDDLTGLPNRRHFHAAVTAQVSDAGATGCAVLLMDLDRFKEINDSLGHHVGDELLALVGPRLNSALGGDDLLARLGGDEFGVLLPGATAEGATSTALALLSVLRAPFDLAGVSLHVDASIGVALFPDHADGVSRLLQCADMAMYRAKVAHNGFEFSDPDVDGADRQRLETIEALRVALDRDELVLHYQPKLDLRSGAVAGVEALVRWQHPNRGLLYPDTFLPLAEQAGLMRRLTMSVLEMALRQADDWRNAGRHLTVAVNLSASNLLDTQLAEQIALLLTTLDLPSDLLELEITETVLMADPVRAHHVLRGLRALGIRLAVDDYGTGYSSLAYLQDLPVDDLKLDRSFVMRSASDPRSAAIVRSTIGLAHSLDMKIIAEGVETAEALRQLARAGCDVAQGYHICRPAPAARISEWLDRYAAGAGVDVASPA